MTPRHSSPERRTSWTSRAIAAFLGLGALAGAFVAMNEAKDEVVPPEPDAERVEITDIELIRASSLPEFTGVRPGIDVTLTPGMGEDTAAGALEVLPAAVGSESTTTPAPETPPPDTDAPATPDPAPSISPQPEEPEPSAPSTPSPTAPDEQTEEMAMARAVVEQAGLGGYAFDPSDLLQLLPPGVSPRVDQTPVGDPSPEAGSSPTTTPLAPEEVAQQLEAALAQVETKTTGTHRDPLGFVISVDFDVQGFKGDNLLLTWALDGQDTPSQWRADTLAYRLTATTNDDRGSVEIWVPDLVRPGPYSINVHIWREDGREPLTDDGLSLTDE